MPVIFANPAGLWALLGIPAILLIHFLQQEMRRVPASTLFLLEAIERESMKGRRFERLRQSLPLWLQLFGVVLLAWLLADPRWTNERSVQRLVLVLDDSVSMEAFREDLSATLRRELPPLVSLVGTTEYSAFESSRGGATVYRGTSLGELLEAIAAWRPASGSHSPEAALRAGRGLAGAAGVLVFVTDHPGDALPFGALRLAVGSAIENVGFAGARVEVEEGRSLWRATLRNDSGTAQSRTWFLAGGGRRTEARRIDLAPRSTRTLQGEFPEGADRLSLVLEADRFARDDRLFLVKPEPKVLLVARAVAAPVESLAADLADSLGNAPPVSPGEAPDLWFATYNPLDPSALPATAVGLLHQPGAPRRFLSGPIVAANHPLVDGLDWQGLIARSTPGFPPDAGDLVLLWQGERPLLILRESAGRRQLLCNFDVPSSNAPRLPAFVVPIHRFAERVRATKVAPESRNLELRQALAVALDAGPEAAPVELSSDGTNETVPVNRARLLRAPAEPGFFRVTQGGVTLLDAAANFADIREADFSGAGAVSELGPLPEAIRERQTVGDPAWPLWILLFSASLLLCWHWLGRRGSGQDEDSEGAAIGHCQGGGKVAGSRPL